MQLSLGFDPSPVVPELRARLRAALGPFPHEGAMDPVDQLVKSLISSRTYDATSWNVFVRLKLKFRDWRALAEAPQAEAEAILGPVAHADNKAVWLPRTLRQILDLRGDFDLGFLAAVPVEEALAWLQQFDGVGPKVAAATLNFSTLRRPVMVVDTHVWRVARRFGLAGWRADPDSVRRIIMQEAPANWTAADFYELHWLMKTLGQTACGGVWMRCGGCPLSRQCARRMIKASSGAPLRADAA